jgi:hypothetical protein
MVSLGKDPQKEVSAGEDADPTQASVAIMPYADEVSSETGFVQPSSTNPTHFTWKLESDAVAREIVS